MIILNTSHSNAKKEFVWSESCFQSYQQIGKSDFVHVRFGVFPVEIEAVEIKFSKKFDGWTNKGVNVLAIRDQLWIFVVDIGVAPSSDSQHGLETGILIFQIGEFFVETLVNVNYWEARPDFEGVFVQFGESIDKVSA